MLKNQDLRNFFRCSGVAQHEIAEKMGCSDMTFIRLLRKDLSNEEKQNIVNIVEKIRSENLSKTIVFHSNGNESGV